MTAADLEARLMAWTKPCPRLGTPDVDGAEPVHAFCCRGVGQVPVLLGVTVERCPNRGEDVGWSKEGIHTDFGYRPFQDRPHDVCGGSGYIWQRENAVLKLVAFGMAGYDLEFLIEVGRRFQNTRDLYEATLQAVDALREKEPQT